jgi:ubiquinone/menaquinone biosynthesis C-methylase UbiE
MNEPFKDLDFTSINLHYSAIGCISDSLKEKCGYYFKIKQLPRIDKVLGLLKGLDFKTILDVGSQRGSFIWKFLDYFEDKKLSSIDLSEKYYNIHKEVLKENAHLGDVKKLPFEDNSFDIITCLEVLEHVADTETVIGELIRAAKKYIILSVPSKLDNNPEHIHYFTNDDIERLFSNYKVKFNSVLNHRIALIKL